MSLSTESIPTIASEVNKEDVPLKVEIGNLRLQDGDVEEKKKKRKSRRSKKRATGFEGRSACSLLKGAVASNASAGLDQD
jgi:hypothetical protein